MTRDDLFAEHKARNTLHTLLLIGGMFVLFAAFGWLLNGARGVLWLIVLGTVSMGFGARMSPQMVLRIYRARPMQRVEAPGLFEIIEQLAQRARLEALPQPYYVPSRMVNAFAVGTLDGSAIGMSDGLLRTLNAREVRGVLAHEITHIRNNDAWVMSLADFVTRTVNLFARVGQLMLFINLPAMLLGGRPPFPFPVLLLLIFAPTLSALMQLGLSRSREYDADLGAARLSGDPRGLASALSKMERVEGGMLERIFLPGRRVPEPSLLRTHPPTDERVRRLLEMEAELDRGQVHIAGEPLPRLARLPVQPARGPRWHMTSGSWY